MRGGSFNARKQWVLGVLLMALATLFVHPPLHSHEADKNSPAAMHRQIMQKTAASTPLETHLEAACPACTVSKKSQIDGLLSKAVIGLGLMPTTRKAFFPQVAKFLIFIFAVFLSRAPPL